MIADQLQQQLIKDLLNNWVSQNTEMDEMNRNGPKWTEMDWNRKQYGSLYFFFFSYTL